MKIDMRTLKGKRFGDLPEPIKTKLLTSYTSIYYGTYFDGIELKEPIIPGEYNCTIDYEDNISIAGKCIVTPYETVYKIDDNTVFYCTTD